MNELDEVVGEFLVESYENLDRLDQDLVTLEDDPRPETLAGIFRTMHTIKGTCGFLGFHKLESVAHAAENLLSLLRDGKLEVSAPVTSALLATGDAVRAMLGSIESTGDEGDGDFSALVAELERLQKPGSSAGKQDSAPAKKKPGTRRSRKKPESAPGKPEDGARLGEILVSKGEVAEDDVTLAVSEQELGDPRKVGEILVDHGVTGPEQVDEALEDQARQRGTSVADTSIRVDVGLLDSLMNLVGELVLARNQILQLTADQPDGALQATSQRLNLITTELQEGAMKTRMQQIGTVWARFPRVVRDLALACGKRVRIEMEGADTELDKSIIEAIKDPLTHLVRNAVDHGIEDPARRVEVAKPEEGRVLLRAYHEGGQVNIEISDDGAGIDPARIRAKALEKGLITPEQSARMADREALQLIFAPGFSTAEKITNVSGRGVGMDVVRSNIERIGGTVDIQSLPGEGTSFKIKIPLTLAIIPALVVSSGGERYAIPQVNLLELVRVEPGESSGAIELIQGAPVYRLRGRLLPLVYLARELGHPEVAGDRAVNIVVLQADDRAFGLVVEEICDSAEIVVKPLGQHLKHIPTFAGATIMGDGRVALILDVMGLAQRAHVVSEASRRTLVDASEVRSGTAAEDTALVVFSTTDGARCAVPLASVDRLEEFEASRIESAGDSRVVQYRDAILELIDVGAVLAAPKGRRRRTRIPSEGTVEVIVHESGGRRVGLAVGRILDIVEETLEVEKASRPGVAGTAVVQGRVTEIVDLPALLSHAGVVTAASATGE